jgi:phytoene/squalene synthetase
VQTYDADRYAANLLAPRRTHAALFALHALNVELALIKDASSEHAVQAIKMAWWHDSLLEMFEGQKHSMNTMVVPNHPVIQVLGPVMRNFKLSRRWVDKLFEAREKDLYVEQPADMDALARYAENSSSSLLYLALEALGSSSLETDHIVGAGTCCLCLY